VKNEGIKTKPYPDGKYEDGRQKYSVGIGVNSANVKHYPKLRADGTVSPADIEKSFIGATNDAARAGIKASKAAGVFNDAGFQLMSELAYQSGLGFLTQENSVGEQYRTVAGALKARNAAAAKAEFQKTAAWRWSNPDRQQHYLKLIERSVKG